MSDWTKAELELESGDWVLAKFRRETSWSHDPDYGADADGHRGIPADFVEEDEIVDVEIQAEEDGPWVKLADLPADMKALVEKSLDQWLKQNDPVPPDPDEPDYEED